MPELPTRGGTFTIERAAAADVPAIVALLADDVLGATREHADLAVYEAAFAQLTTDARRPEALRFYERIGYAPSHVGCKLALDRGHGGDEGEGAAGIGTAGEPDADAAPGEDMTDAAGPFGGAVTR